MTSQGNTHALTLYMVQGNGPTLLGEELARADSPWLEGLGIKMIQKVFISTRCVVKEE